MRKISVRLLAIGFLFFIVCLLYYRTFIMEMNGLDDFTSLKKLSDENISSIQFNVMRMDIKKFGRANAKKLVNYMESTIVPENRTTNIQKVDDYDVITFIYRDGTKDMFYFFIRDNAWYLETPDGSQYKNADFITDYIERVDITEAKTTFIQKPAVWQLELEKETEVFDTAFFFKELVYYNVNEYGMGKEEAIDDARKSMQTDRTLYQYALENGYGLTGQELQQLLQEEIAQAKLAENYEEVSALYREQGLSLETYLENREEKLAVSKTIAKLYNAKYEEFRHGKDTIKGQVCENVTEYWNAFILEEVQPQMAEYDFSEFQKELDAAENGILAEMS